MLSNLRTLCPNIEIFLDVGFSPPMDPQNLSIEDEKNLHLEAQVSNEFLSSLSPKLYLLLKMLKCKSSHEIWTKRKVFDVSTSHEDGGTSEELSSHSHHEELQVTSTSGRNEFSSSSTSPMCGKTQGNDMVSGDENCNVDIGITIDNLHLYLIAMFHLWT